MASLLPDSSIEDYFLKLNNYGPYLGKPKVSATVGFPAEPTYFSYWENPPFSITAAYNPGTTVTKACPLPSKISDIRTFGATKYNAKESIYTLAPSDGSKLLLAAKQSIV